MKRWLFWKQVDVILTRATLAAVLLTEWTPPAPIWLGTCMAVGVLIGAIVLIEIATGGVDRVYPSPGGRER